VSNKEFIYTEEQLMARLKFFIGICLALTLTGIVFVVLYSIIFVTQPLNAISPIDQKFFELIIPIATFLTGTLSGIMLAGTKKEVQEAALAAQKLANEAFASAKTPAPPAAPVRSMSSPMGMQATAFTPMQFRQEPTLNVEPVGEVVVGYGGKPAPFQAPHPEL
jgi:hypothetical protein